MRDAAKYSIPHFEAMSAAHYAVLDALEARRIANMTSDAADRAISACRAKIAELERVIAHLRKGDA